MDQWSEEKEMNINIPHPMSLSEAITHLQDEEIRLYSEYFELFIKGVKEKKDPTEKDLELLEKCEEALISIKKHVDQFSKENI